LQFPHHAALTNDRVLSANPIYLSLQARFMPENSACGKAGFGLIMVLMVEMEE
jgi:hypothetical protein